MIKPTPIKLSVEYNNKKLLLENPSDISIDEMVETFKIMMKFISFTDDQINDVFHQEDIDAPWEEDDEGSLASDSRMSNIIGC